MSIIIDVAIAVTVTAANVAIRCISTMLIPEGDRLIQPKTKTDAATLTAVL